LARRHGLRWHARQNSKMLQYSRCACLAPASKRSCHSSGVNFVVSVIRSSFMHPRSWRQKKFVLAARMRPSFANYDENFASSR
jgi:hypothetical protein